MNRLRKLPDYGQSYWMDNLSRELIHGGELQREIRDRALRGITSNPSIFGQAIGSSNAYDAQIAAGARAGRSALQIYEDLTTSDIRDACDVLLPVFHDTDGADGFVSLEVAPGLARDTAGSIREGAHLAALVDRPNLMIKIPGTAEGVPAIEELLFRGVNVNVTLLFGIESYQAVAEAWLRALERRHAAGQPVARVASVASFFVSRIDTLVDELLAHRISPDGSSAFEPHPKTLLGQVAVANAKLAYAAYRRMAAGERWKAMAAAGARPQRLLWASTGTKNHAYSDVAYVEPLIGPDTVNTMPEATAVAFDDHGKLGKSLVRSVPAARQVLKALKAVGIDLKRVTWQLENEGIQKFIGAFDKLIANIDEKRRNPPG
ncbi:MAG: transaldolase [Gammaproteobacteria bacterium PRO9]|nr:transaldolase [Gammaproteobacteria bacterium PRO9]